VTASPPKLTPPGIRSDLDTLLELINSAEDKIFVDVFQYGLTSPYTDNNLEQLDFALRRASQRGVKVHVLVSTWSLGDPQHSHLESLQAMPNVTVRAIGFPTHSSGYHSYARTSHPKMLLVDGRYAWVGSANWQPGYFSESRNLGLVTNHSTVTEDLKTFFLTAWTSSHAQELSGAVPTEKPSVPYHW
jgi:phosphatidylserine/phosphatidylglycerophosphate/cardiolipin synthase-like enzyme